MKDLNEIVLVLGGSSSGKSSFAEDLCYSPQKKYYLATMERPYEQSSGFEEISDRIRRHRENRQGKGFITIEAARDIEEIIEKEIEGRADIILLESLSTLLSNEMFRDGIIINEKECEKKILTALEVISKKTKRLVIVSDEIFSDGMTYDETVKDYLCCLAALHRMIAGKAAAVYEVYYGIPGRIK